MHRVRESMIMYPAEKLRLSNYIKKDSFDIQRFFTDLFTEKISVQMFVNRCDLVRYSNGQEVESPLLESTVGLDCWKDVYAQRVYELFYKVGPIQDDFLKTAEPYDELFGDGLKYICHTKLESFDQLFFNQDISSEYFQLKASKIRLTKLAVVVNETTIKINPAQYAVLSYMCKFDVGKFFQNSEIDSANDPKIKDLNMTGKFQISTVFKNKPKVLITINKGTFSLSQLWSKAEIIVE